MKKTILFFILVVLFFHLDAQVLITTSQMNSINSSLGAFEGQIYKNSETNIYYIGLSSGTLKSIGDLNSINANSTLTGNGSASSPLGLAQQGANSGQVLSWNGTSWVPVNAADGSETNINNGINTTVTGAGTIASPYLINVADATATTKGVIQLAGDLTGTATLPQIAANAVTTAEILDGTVSSGDIGNAQVLYAKIQNVTGQRLLGNPTTTAAAPSEISLGAGLTFTGTVLNTVNNGTVTNVTGNSPITVTNGTTTPNISITRNNIVAGTSSNTATNPLVLDAGATSAVVGGANATLTVNNTAPLWNANQLQGKNISIAAPTNGQVLAWNDTTSQWTPTSSTLTSENGVDIGYIVAWGSNTTPPDYLLPLTGGTYNWADFPHFQTFQTTHPSQFIASSTATTFTLKDINTSGRFLRGGLTAGVNQNGSTAMPINPFVLSNYTHNHSFTNAIYVFSSQDIYNGVDYPRYSYNSEYNETVTTSDDTHTHNISGGDSETRPINTSVIWCLKVKPTSTTGNITINNNTLSETITNLTQNATTGQISYTNESNNTQTANVVSANSNNSIQVGTDGGAYYQKKVFEAYDNSGSSQNITQTATTLNINTIRLNIGSIYTLNNDEITISEDGIFRITYTAGLYYSSGSYINGQFWLEINSSAYSGTYLYLGSRSNTYTCASKSVILQLSSGNTIRVRHQRFNTNLNTIPQCTSINIEKLN